MRPANLFYTADVVDDLIAVQQLYTETVGQRWNAITESRCPIETSTGPNSVVLRWSFSTEDLGHRVRLIQSVPGTMWLPADSGLHHHGYWSDDVDADVRALEASGATLEVRSRMPDGRTAWAYCRSPAGIRLEFVDRSQQSILF